MRFSAKPNFVLELALFSLISLAIGAIVLPGNPGFVGVHPNPNWLIIILIAFRYGFVAGAISGAVCAAGYLYFGIKFGHLHLGESSFPHGDFHMPFLFALFGAIFGELQERRKAKVVHVQQELQETTNELADLGLLHATTVEAKEELELRIATQTTTLLGLFETFNEIEGLQISAQYAEVLRLLEEKLRVECASIYMLRDKDFQLQCRRGEVNERTPKNEVRIRSTLMGEVARTKRLALITSQNEDVSPEFIKEAGIVISAPIKKRDDTIIGVINIERLPFFLFNTYTMRIFDMISTWLSISVDHALQMKEARENALRDEVSGAYTLLYFSERLESEFRRARRAGTLLSVSILRIPDFDKLSYEMRGNVLAIAGLVFQRQFRDQVIVARYKSDDTFVVLFPDCALNEARVLTISVCEEVRNYQFRPYNDEEEILTLNFGFAELADRMQGAADLLQAAEANLERRPQQSRKANQVSEASQDVRT